VLHIYDIMMIHKRHATVLSIAGSDSGGASGIQADLKTFAAYGVHGTSAVAAVTAQDLRSVFSIRQISPGDLRDQIQAVLDGFDVGAVKIGMLGSAANVRTVAETLRAAQVRNIVLDPVLVSSSGTDLLSTRGIAVMRAELIPQAAVLTPNLPEAGALLGRRVREPQMAKAVQELLALGSAAVLLKGGHGRGRIVRDVFAQPGSVREFRHARLAINARGTGCVLSSAIACELALGRDVDSAIEGAQRFLQRALRAAYRTDSKDVHVLWLIAPDKS
jgi:hydroxymethylpyrimidine/phosphomethylpyrimidine kinase